MRPISRPIPPPADSPSSSHEVFRERRELLAAAAAERSLRRQQRLAEQRSALNAPEERIRIWEEIHEVRLPLSPVHAVLHIVAQGTGLTLEQVRAEQQARRARLLARSTT